MRQGIVLFVYNGTLFFLINCDAKLFVKRFANRFIKTIPLLITPYQTTPADLWQRLG